MKKHFNSYKMEGKWYPDNTMSLVGLSLRDMYPQLTNKWYQVVPVDLTQEGTFHYYTAVSNLYYIGDCIVTIRDGTVTTDYTLPNGEIYPRSHCLMWFTSIDDITTKFLNAPQSKYRFGQPVSIAEDLNGQDIALLFICNHVDYRIPLSDSGAMPHRFFRGRSEIRKMTAEMTALLNKMKKGDQQ